jgi:hypothetical protein
MKKRIADFIMKVTVSSILFNLICLIMIIIPIGLAIGVTIDYSRGIVYEDIPVWFAWVFGILTSLGLFALWSISWEFQNEV